MNKWLAVLNAVMSRLATNEGVEFFELLVSKEG
jgi:hypothetical protein